ncbi:hypothetical protein [Streptomyces sp. MN13]
MSNRSSLVTTPSTTTSASPSRTVTCAAVGSTLTTLKGLPRAEDADGVHHPGERSAAVAAGRAEQGVPVAPKVWRDLTDRAARLGVALPDAAA